MYELLYDWWQETGLVFLITGSVVISYFLGIYVSKLRQKHRWISDYEKGKSDAFVFAKRVVWSFQTGKGRTGTFFVGNVVDSLNDAEHGFVCKECCLHHNDCECEG